MPSEYKDYIYLAKADFSAVTFWVSSLSLLLMAYSFDWTVTLISAILWFTSFDILGWKWLVTCGEVPTVGRSTAYRSLQFPIMIMIAVLLALKDWTLGTSFMVFWWTGGCDLLYYPLSSSEFQWDDRYDWLTGWVWIFPAGLLCKLFGGMVHLWSLVLNVLLGVGIIILLRCL
jgi:uncharacterized membrane protein YgcG